MQDIKSIVASNITKFRKSKQLTQKKLADLIGTTNTTICNWEKGVSSVDIDSLYKISKALNVSLGELFDEESFNNTYPPLTNAKQKELSLMPEQVSPVSVQRVPLLGRVAAGQPILAEEDFENYFEVDADIKCDFCLYVKGDSMKNARINDGDIVFIQQQSDVNNGEIGVVLIDDEATLKRIYKGKNSITLSAENSKYEPIVISADDAMNVRILGKAVAFQSDVK